MSYGTYRVDKHMFQCMHCGWVFTATGELRQESSGSWNVREYLVATCPHCWQDVKEKY